MSLVLAMLFSHFFHVGLLSVFVGGSNGSVLKRTDGNHWVDTWASMPQLCEPGNLPPAPFTQTGAVFEDSTIRQTLHMSIGGPSIRIRLSNAFGVSDLSITAVTVALPAKGLAGVSAIVPNTVKPVTFSGSNSYIVPNGGLIVSDPIDLKVEAQSMLTVTIYLADGQKSSSNAVTAHTGSRTDSWLSKGNQVSALSFTDPSSVSVAHWYYVSAVEVYVPQTSRAFVIVGDSITDGRGSDTNQNNRWPDRVLKKMQLNPSTANIAVINQGAGGNRILHDGLGPSAFSRIDRDVFGHSGVAYAMIFEGVNDIAGPTDPTTQKQIGDRLIASFTQIAIRVKTFNMPVFAATITPFSAPGYDVSKASYSNPEREKTRQRINEWIRTSGTFDHVLDFDKWLRNETNPSQMIEDYHDGDYLHPNAKGYQRIADMFPLDIF